MQLGETIATYDVDLALRGESGKFEVTSPAGEIYYINCKPNSSISKSASFKNQTFSRAFFVRKVAESVSLEHGNTAVPAIEKPPTTITQAPFLIGPEKNETVPSGADFLGTEFEMLAEHDSIWNLELTHSQTEGSERPTARVCVKTGRKDDTGEKPEIALTAPCATLNELDIEIRRLQAQLNEISSRAKKIFYKAAAAASA
ncbi:MAG: hypothetical protein WBS24_03675 [Terriglobales bacterium]